MTSTRGARRRVFLLKYFDTRDWRADGGGENSHLPYAVDTISRAGVDLEWSDASHRRPWASRPVRAIVRRLERLTTPFLQTALATRRIAQSDAVLAVFESQGNFLALLRSLRVWPYTRPCFGVVCTWLAMDAARFGRWRRRGYRHAYRGVDRVIYFSRNQGPILRERLAIREERLAWVPFGVDHEFFAPRDVNEEGYVLAVGRDSGRDWRTLCDAVRDTDLAVKVACRPGALEALAVPPNVEVLGWVDRLAYRELTARARVVVVPTKVLAYPSGQSVVLESMAMGKCCVVTDTPAMRDYLDDGVNALLVAPHDSGALRSGIERAWADDVLRARVGAAARQAVEQQFNAVAMWRRIAEVLADAADRRGRR